MILNEVLDEIKKFVNKHDDDLVDRFNNRYTVILLAVFMVLIAGKQYYGDPIVCWTPASFTGAHTQYANTICWTYGTYPVTTDQLYHQVDRSKVLPYYQWIPFLLLFQAACFMIPHLIWQTFSKTSGLDVTELGLIAKKIRNFDTNRIDVINQITRHIKMGLELKSKPVYRNKDIEAEKKLKKFILNSRRESYLYVLYMIVKLLYILNLVFQIVLMDVFFEFRNYSFGFEFLKKFLKGDDYSRIDKAFPRVTFCDFTIRNLGDNLHKHSVQCALPINLFNEKFFIVLWFWLLFLALITICNFFSWFRIIFKSIRRKTIIKYLKSNEIDPDDQTGHLNTFVDSFCNLDGAFVFAIIRRNTNYMTTSDIITSLYHEYSSSRPKFIITNLRNNNVNNTAIEMSSGRDEDECSCLKNE